MADLKEQVERLKMNVRVFKAFLKDTIYQKRWTEERLELASQMRHVVYKAEDIIDAFMMQPAADSETKSYFTRASGSGTQAKLLRGIARDVETIGANVRRIYSKMNSTDDHFANLNLIGDGGPPGSKVPLLQQGNVVGFEDEAEMLIEYLLEETQQLDVVSIVGMPGLGKTTLAGKIFRDPVIQYKFPVRIWVYISQEFKKKDVFLAILRQFERMDEGMYCKSDQELAQLVAAHLRRENFLIVMDDIWTSADWYKLQIALLESTKKGKVLITTRHVEVAQHANRRRIPHNLRLLTQNESWLLLQYEVFARPECPPELEFLGKLIAEQCCGLPLAIVVIGGILTKKFKATDNMSRNVHAWTRVSENISTYLDEDPERRMAKTIALSYDKLPYHLRACFLYFGIFPEGFEIPVQKLIRMWIAEGFVQQNVDLSLEAVAEDYLEELINRNLLTVDKRRFKGGIKTCRIHNMLRAFCKNEARSKKENFLQEVKRYDGEFEPSVTSLETCRRLCIHSDVLKFLSSQPHGPRLHSFVCFSKENITLEGQDISTIPAAFKMLRVLETMSIKFARIPSNMDHLLHLRYLTLSLNVESLPEYFSKFCNLQTLIIYTTSRTLEIKANIWKMIHLNLLKTNASANMPKIEKSSKANEYLQTLDGISPQSCKKELFERARNLKKLGIRGQLAVLLDDNNRSFNLAKLGYLVELKLQNDVCINPPSRCQLHGLPSPFKFPPKLKTLTLSYTSLDCVHISILGMLEKLEVLKLKDKAFMGDCWEVGRTRFPSLKFLHIGRTNLVTWVALGHHFPKLRSLELHNCDQLREIPIGLADAPYFLALDLCHSKLAVASAKKIQKAKQKKQEEQNPLFNGFKLSVFPPEE
ncbi:putative late blight resistance proteinR1C-3 [Sesamum angolense]|uniref:Late blight resistance proteinR1C-3 n=1 Tax=Sesamum angolense TaxID=2727404 RepID=A0AAE1WKH5_9LAMI|nr:putative late blight resistance proteinR1C-3 [Sesamum angolense]